MVVVHVQVTIFPAKRGTFLEIMAKHMEINRQLKGNLCFKLSQDVEDLNKFYIYEEWESRDAFTNYKKNSTFQKTISQIFPLYADGPHTYMYEAELFGP